jgi:NADH dehydrogenase (ubiquinone) Fe-S protein 1
MIKIWVNNSPIFVPKNTSVLEACEALGVLIPRFCYHERLNIAGNCRMCLVEVEKTLKPVASCASPVVPNMKIFTNTPLVQKARENVLEFLLMNHPLDCPICDQGGECDLQEQTLAFGSEKSRFFYTKRTVENKNCGPLIKTIMTRCIHCTRCVRFLQEVAGEEDFGTTLRGKETEIGTYINKVLVSELSGNIIDLCPVGALTSKPYAFAARPWEIKSFETIDISDSVGSNIKVNFKEMEVLRILPVLNDSLNEEWISDKTRFLVDALKQNRIGYPYFNKDSVFSKVNWRESLSIFSRNFNKYLKFNPNNILFVSGNNVDLESLQILKEVSQNLGISLISENFLNTERNLMYSVKSNVTFTDVLNSDLCLSVGTNTRFEASLFNVRLKKCIKTGNFIHTSIGLTDNLTYASDSIGTSIQTLLKIAEGKHKFCQRLVRAKRPFIILGSSIKKRLDAKSITFLVENLSQYANVLNEDWVGINFLPTTASTVGEVFSGVNTENKLTLKDKKFVYCVGLDSYDSLFSSLSMQDTFIIAQTPFADPSLKKVNLLIPSNAFTEKEGTFLNLEGRSQKTVKSFTGPSLARGDVKILYALFSSFLNTNSAFPKSFCPPSENKNSFTKTILMTRSKLFLKIYKTSIKTIIFNFFISNILTKNSITLGKCSAIFKKNYTNFF